MLPARNNRVLIAVTNHGVLGDTGKNTGWFLPEVAHPYHVFTKNQLKVDFISPSGGIAPVDEGSIKDYAQDPICAEFLNNKSAIQRLNSTLSPSQIDPKDYDGIFFAGGHGTVFDFPQSTSLLKLAADIYENSGAIAAVCHGPVALTELKLSNGEYLVKGKLVTGFTNEEEDYVGLTNVVPFLLEDRLKERGGNFIGVGKFECNVQQSERLITGQNPQSSKVTAERMVSLLLLENQ